MRRVQRGEKANPRAENQERISRRGAVRRVQRGEKANLREENEERISREGAVRRVQGVKRLIQERKMKKGLASLAIMEMGKYCK